MSDEDDRDLKRPCRQARALVHARADGALDEVARARLDAHLSACADCLAFADEIDRVREALADLPEVPLPDDALRAVWAQTVDSEPWWRRAWVPLPAWRPVLSAAAALVLAGAALWLALDGRGTPPPPAAAGDEELARALAETRYALALAGDAMRRSEQAALDRVLVGEVAPALDRIPVRWPSAESPRRNGT